jgi:hypothetical protein
LLFHHWKIGHGRKSKNLTVFSSNVNCIRSVLDKNNLQNYIATKKFGFISKKSRYTRRLMIGH